MSVGSKKVRRTQSAAIYLSYGGSENRISAASPDRYELRRTLLRQR